jgi:putative transposase
MDTHYHALVEARLDGLSAGCHLLNGRHAQRFNERHGRVGHLFGDRFHVRVLASEAHLAATRRYIRENPVRAGVCETADDWPWSGSLS